LSSIDAFIFSTSSSIHTIDFIGNPITRIRSHAFDGLRNVADLIISTSANSTPIVHIEPDSFISTAFVERIFLQGISARVLHRNSFRGLLNCKILDLSNSNIDEVQAHAFYHTRNVDYLNMRNCQIRSLHPNAFSGMQSVRKIDLRENYISKLSENIFKEILNDYDVNETMHSKAEDSKFFLFDQNPIDCDCSLRWVIESARYSKLISLPEICAGPRGYDCLRISDLRIDNLSCQNTHGFLSFPCENLMFNFGANLTENDMELVKEHEANFNSISKAGLQQNLTSNRTQATTQNRSQKPSSLSSLSSSWNSLQRHANRLIALIQVYFVCIYFY